MPRTARRRKTSETDLLALIVAVGSSQSVDPVLGPECEVIGVNFAMLRDFQGANNGVGVHDVNSLLGLAKARAVGRGSGNGPQPSKFSRWDFPRPSRGKNWARWRIQWLSSQPPRRLGVRSEGKPTVLRRTERKQ